MATTAHREEIWVPGMPEPISHFVHVVRAGRLVFVGYSEDSLQVHPIQLVVGEQVVTASVGNTLAELRLAVDLVASGRVATVVDRTLPLERFQEGIDALAAGRLVGRAVLAP